MSTPAFFPSFSPEALETAFLSFAPLLADLAPQAFPQPYPASRVITALESLVLPLSLGAAGSGAMNIWSIAGLKRDEVRTGQALAGLWTADFGGAASRQFLSAFLDLAIADIDWETELALGYRVATECNPLGDSSDRMDLIIETRNHMVGIEIKIGAVLGIDQLPRYIAAVQTRAAWRHSQPHVILLAPFETTLDKVHSVSWSAVCDAAFAVGSAGSPRRSTVEELIVSFGEHVRNF